MSHHKTGKALHLFIMGLDGNRWKNHIQKKIQVKMEHACCKHLIFKHGLIMWKDCKTKQNQTEKQVFLTFGEYSIVPVMISNEPHLSVLISFCNPACSDILKSWIRPWGHNIRKLAWSTREQVLPCPRQPLVTHGPCVGEAVFDLPPQCQEWAQKQVTEQSPLPSSVMTKSPAVLSQ